MPTVALTILFVSLCVVEISCWRAQLYESSSVVNDPNTVLLGGLFPVHDTNDDKSCAQLQEFAIQQMEAMVFAIQSINKNDSLLPNVTLAFSIRDSCSNPTYALEQTFHYVQSMNGTCTEASGRVAVSGVVGAHFSRTSTDVASLLRLYKIPQISYISTADVLSDKTRFDYFFRTVPPDRLQAGAIADIIVRFNWTFVFALYSDDSYGNGGIEALINELTMKGVCIAARLALPVTASSTDYDAVLRNMSAEWVRNASIAVLFGHLDAATGIMQALIRFKIKSSVLNGLTWIGTDAWGDSLPSDYHQIARGMLSVIPRAVESQGFDEHFTSLHPSNSSNIWFREFWESRFNCSLTEMTCESDNEPLSLSAEEHKQISEATLVMDAVMAFAHAIQSLIESRCPDNVLCDDILTETLTGRAVKGELIREHLYNISFQGVSTNLIDFDRQGDEQGAYTVKNLQTISENKYSFEEVGLWHYLTSLEVDVDRIEWVNYNDTPESFCSSPCEGGQYPKPTTDLLAQCCWTCSPCQSEKGYSDGISQCMDCNTSHMPNPQRTGCVPIPVTFLQWSDTWAIVLITVTLCGLVVTVCVSLIFTRYACHGIIKASSREISAILLLGLILCYLMPFPFVAMPSVAICTIRRFGVGFSFAVCYSALLVKINRIQRIFNQRTQNHTKPLLFISPLSQVVFTVLLVSVQVLIAVIWLAVERPSTDTVYESRSAELRCGSSPVIGLSVTLGYNFLLLLCTTYFAFHARKVPENFNEARYINVTVYTLCIIWLAFIPTYFTTAKLGAVFQTSSLMIAIILSATTTLAFLFVPRLILLVAHLNEKDNKSAMNSHPSLPMSANKAVTVFTQ